VEGLLGQGSETVSEAWRGHAVHGSWAYRKLLFFYESLGYRVPEWLPKGAARDRAPINDGERGH